VPVGPDPSGVREAGVVNHEGDWKLLRDVFRQLVERLFEGKLRATPACILGMALSFLS